MTIRTPELVTIQHTRQQSAGVSDVWWFRYTRCRGTLFADSPIATTRISLDSHPLLPAMLRDFSNANKQLSVINTEPGAVATGSLLD